MKNRAQLFSFDMFVWLENIVRINTRRRNSKPKAVKLLFLICMQLVNLEIFVEVNFYRNMIAYGLHDRVQRKLY
jgi:hypothetical protein